MKKSVEERVRRLHSRFESDLASIDVSDEIGTIASYAIARARYMIDYLFPSTRTSQERLRAHIECLTYLVDLTVGEIRDTAKILGELEASDPRAEDESEREQCERLREAAEWRARAEAGERS